MSLPSPLTASDEHIKIRNKSLEIVRVTAGLHRQVWVSGTSLYADVHIMNNSRKMIKRIELQIERDVLCYKHVGCRERHFSVTELNIFQAAASTMEKSASQARIFDTNERSIISKSLIKQGSAGWHGVPPHTTHIRTCDLGVPRGHATVKCGVYTGLAESLPRSVIFNQPTGKYFEVRYFLNVIGSISRK